MSYWPAQPRQNITSGLPYTAHNQQLIRQHSSRTDPPYIPSKRTTTTALRNVLGPLFRSSSQSEDISRTIQHDVLENEIANSFSVLGHNLTFDPGASTLGAPPPPWEAQRPPRVEMSSCTPAALVDLCCRALHCRHVYMVFNGP